MNKHEEVAREVIKAINETCSDVHNGLRLEECKACGPKLKRILPILERAYGQGEQGGTDIAGLARELWRNKMVKHETCKGCGNEIDPDVCWCGDLINSHSGYEGHLAIPIGCDCGREISEASLRGSRMTPTQLRATKQHKMTVQPYIIPGRWTVHAPAPNGDWRAERSLVRRSPGAAVSAMVRWLKRESWERWFKRVYGRSIKSK